MTQEQEDFEENFYLGGTKLVFGADGEGVDEEMPKCLICRAPNCVTCDAPIGDDGSCWCTCLNAAGSIQVVNDEAKGVDFEGEQRYQFACCMS